MGQVVLEFSRAHSGVWLGRRRLLRRVVVPVSGEPSCPVPKEPCPLARGQPLLLRSLTHIVGGPVGLVAIPLNKTRTVAQIQGEVIAERVCRYYEASVLEVLNVLDDCCE